MIDKFQYRILHEHEAGGGTGNDRAGDSLRIKTLPRRKAWSSM
jgi:hypothetical protein